MRLPTKTPLRQQSPLQVSRQHRGHPVVSTKDQDANVVIAFVFARVHRRDRGGSRRVMLVHAVICAQVQWKTSRDKCPFWSRPYVGS